MKNEKAYFGGGCFWCLEAIFDRIKGVIKVVSGYAGGNVINPNYEQVCSGETGHAEVVEVEFDPSEINYLELLNIFFGVHDPTTLNRQGADVGSQYRSVIFYTSDEQKKLAENKIVDLEKEKVFENKIVTEIEPFTKFYPAEKYHQKYFENNPDQRYCSLVISPKIVKLRKKYKKYLKTDGGEEG